jgi:hypothetical protein
MLNARRAHRRPLGESPNQFIQELFRTDLQVEGVSAVLDTDVEELIVLESTLSALVPRASLSSPLYSGQTYRQRQQRDILVSGIDKVDYLNGSFPGSVTGSK